MTENVLPVKQPKGRVRIYSCGGGGLNIGSRFERYRDNVAPGFAYCAPVYIDTSRANLNTAISDDNCYLLKEVDGSGKVRAQNHQEIAKVTRDIIQKFPPLDYNIVISTASGGSGSVIAPLLTAELLSKGAITVVVTIGSTTSVKEAENTLKTLKSYDVIARSEKVNSPVVMSYIQNTGDISRAQADEIQDQLICSLCILFSRENKALDTADLENWAFFNRPGVTPFGPQLVSLHVCDSSADAFNALGNIMSVATITTEEVGSRLPDVVIEYHTEGFLIHPIEAISEDKEPLHFVTADGQLPKVMADLEALLKKAEDTRNSRIAQKAISSEQDKPTDTLLVL